MDTSGWRDRLRREIEAQKRTLRSVSMKAGLGESYVSGILNEMKDPSVERLAAVCNELHVSLSAILFGTTDTPEQEEFLNLLQRAPDPVRQLARGLRFPTNFHTRRRCFGTPFRSLAATLFHPCQWMKARFRAKDPLTP